MDPFSNSRIALFNFNRDHNSITNDEWVAWFKSAFEEYLQDLDVLKQRLQRAIRDKPQAPSREGGRDDDAKNNGRVGGKADTIVPKTAEPPATKGCLKCGDMSHRDAGEAETPLVAQVKRWKEGIKVLVNQPQRQKTGRGVLLENIVRVDDVLLDYGSDVTVVTRGVMDALDATGVKVGTVSHNVLHLAYPEGSDTKPVVTTRSVKFNCVTLDTRCGLLVLRGLKAWVDDASTATQLIVKWDVSSVPTNKLSGMANVKRLMAEKLNPPKLDPDDGMKCATPEIYRKTSVQNEAGRRRTKQTVV
ncbi:hypothetical protein DYB34_010211 [Aphanomyces astaci]|uniref:Peptidase A2 domain-containing protein n=1 Tax=Aphanomyces astaci TaxID=112090 RepID=A0A3R6X0S3_APHAT|nr:hypothetical protein DYB34_010211 [Aphanomyces astaci]